jgi:hypothetical protein
VYLVVIVEDINDGRGWTSLSVSVKVAYGRQEDRFSRREKVTILAKGSSKGGIKRFVMARRFVWSSMRCQESVSLPFRG